MIPTLNLGNSLTARAGGDGGGAGAAHLFWRIVNPNTPGPGNGTVLEPAEIQIFDGSGDVTSSATKTSTTPSFSTLSVLFNGNLNDRCQWAN